LGAQLGSAPEDADVMVERQIAKVSIAGAGMIGRPGVAAQMFTTLAAAGVNIQMISTSEVKVSCVIDAVDCDRAIAALCGTFEVTSSSARLTTSAPAPTTDEPSVRGVALDRNQARLAIRHVPDRPGMAARIFQILAQHNISDDMIIQSQRCRVVDGMTTRDIACTVAQIDAEAARQALMAEAAELGCGEIVVDNAIAKVSIVGTGMVGRPGVAAKMFEALAAHQVNIQMIATSEIKVSCVVSEDQGIQALQTIHAAFGLSGSQKIEVPA
jgi:aspartate kinase